MANLNSWNSRKVINTYVENHALQKPEAAILDVLKNKLPDWRMLDIGIGLGRTTLHFAPLVKAYTGIDYSKNMIQTFHQLHPELNANISVQVGDARSMQAFDADSFDFALFSFNGIDYVSHDDRYRVFQEIKRVVKNGGTFVFSTHNLQYIDNLYSVKIEKGLKYSAYQCYKYFRLLYENGFPQKYRNRDFAILNDGANHFSLKTYYIKPSAQIEQLEQAGFSDISLFSYKTGEKLNSANLNGASKDSWIYYMCRI
ncbi:MAG: class I SAM-dependent methyltransferase [Saprospiraceae bacterium]